MIGYRSIGEDEFRFLVDSDNPVYGRYKYSTLNECGCTLPYGVISFFTEDIKWHDRRHIFDLKVNIPDDAQKGISVYETSEKFGETKVFTGRSGKTKYEIEEAFVRFYNPEDVIEMNVHNQYTDTYIDNVVVPFCKKFNVTLIRFNWRNHKEEVCYKPEN